MTGSNYSPVGWFSIGQRARVKTFCCVLLNVVELLGRLDTGRSWQRCPQSDKRSWYHLGQDDTGEIYQFILEHFPCQKKISHALSIRNSLHNLMALKSEPFVRAFAT